MPRLSPDHYCRRFLDYHYRFYSLAESRDLNTLDRLRRLSIDRARSNTEAGVLVAVDEDLYQQEYGKRQVVIRKGWRTWSVNSPWTTADDDRVSSVVDSLVEDSNRKDAEWSGSQPPLLCTRGRRKRDATFYFNVDIDLPVNLIEAQFERYKREMVSKIIQVQKGLTGVLTHYQILDARGQNVKSSVFDTWERQLDRYQRYANGATMRNMAVDHLAGIGKHSPSDAEIKSVQSIVEQDIKAASVFIRRAERGTFPYDEDGEWAYGGKPKGRNKKD